MVLPDVSQPGRGTSSLKIDWPKVHSHPKDLPNPPHSFLDNEEVAAADLDRHAALEAATHLRSYTQRLDVSDDTDRDTYTMVERCVVS